MSNLNNIEEKLYKANLKSNFTRQQAYLAVNSALQRNKEVPRAYFLHNNITEETLDQLVVSLLYCDNSHIVEDTNKLLSYLNISTKQLSSLNEEEVEEILSLIDDLLMNGWGKGIIIYDYLRVMPSDKCQVLDILNSFVSTYPKYYELSSILRKRLDQGLDYLSDLNSVFPKGERRYNPTILSKSYQLILEKIWRTNWNNNLNYMVLPDEEALLSKLIFMKEI